VDRIADLPAQGLVAAASLPLRAAAAHLSVPAVVAVALADLWEEAHLADLLVEVWEADQDQ
jgi:hypothetical protein